MVVFCFLFSLIRVRVSIRFSGTESSTRSFFLKLLRLKYHRLNPVSRTDTSYPERRNSIRGDLINPLTVFVDRVLSSPYVIHPIMILTDIMYSYMVNGWLVMSTLLLSPGTTTTTTQSPDGDGDDLAALLRPLLSRDAEVFLPGTNGFDNGTVTLAAKKPQLDLLVKVATAEDVQITVSWPVSLPFPPYSLISFSRVYASSFFFFLFLPSPLPSHLGIIARIEKVNKRKESDNKKVRFSNEHSRPFLAISGGHGETWNKGLVKNGIGISMTKLAYVNVSGDGTSATIGGGSKTGGVIRALWSQGKQAGKSVTNTAFPSTSQPIFIHGYEMKDRKKRGLK